MNVRKLHHAAYRCTDAAATVDFYTRVLNLKFAHAVRNDNVPSTGEFYPHLHIFFEMADGSYVAFFELPTEGGTGLDDETPDWVQHLALEVDSPEVLTDCLERIREQDVEVLGPINHGFVQSIYFFDPSGHRLELTCRTDAPGELAQGEIDAPKLLEQWLIDRQAWSGPQ